jgi:hypothetical protein
MELMRIAIGTSKQVFTIHGSIAMIERCCGENSGGCTWRRSSPKWPRPESVWRPAQDRITGAGYCIDRQLIKFVVIHVPRLPTGGSVGYVLAGFSIWPPNS